MAEPIIPGGLPVSGIIPATYPNNAKRNVSNYPGELINDSFSLYQDKPFKTGTFEQVNVYNEVPPTGIKAGNEIEINLSMLPASAQFKVTKGDAVNGPNDLIISVTIPTQTAKKDFIFKNQLNPAAGLGSFKSLSVGSIQPIAPGLPNGYSQQEIKLIDAAGNKKPFEVIKTEIESAIRNRGGAVETSLQTSLKKIDDAARLAQSSFSKTESGFDNNTLQSSAAKSKIAELA